MISLPDYDQLNIASLSSCFDSVTNSYKYFWFLAFLDSINERDSLIEDSVSDRTFISFEHLSMRMLDMVWYPLSHFKLSFGIQDGFKLLINRIEGATSIDSTVNSKPIATQLQETLSALEADMLISEVTILLKKYVSKRFLRPFYQDKLRGLPDQQIDQRIIELSNSIEFQNRAPYKIVKLGIIVNPNWLPYLRKNHCILTSFTRWHLLKFLQKNNPNVIGLSEKLIKPQARNLKQAKKFWTEFLSSNQCCCVYTNKPLNSISFSLDHYIPWSYCTHDLLWNIVPTLRSVNSSKCDLLPSMDLYFQPFSELQYEVMRFHTKRSKIYDRDYLTLTGALNLLDLSLENFQNILKRELDSNIRTAQNLGFQYPFIYQN
jgi:hypothetical protein